MHASPQNGTSGQAKVAFLEPPNNSLLLEDASAFLVSLKLASIVR